MLSDALESLVNLASAMFGLAMVTVAERSRPTKTTPTATTRPSIFPAASRGAHHRGRLAIVWTASHRCSTRSRWRTWAWGLALSILSSALNGLLAWVMLRKAREHRSMALEADARHLVTDVWTSAAWCGHWAWWP
jgi:divalent metal cation (Fe/Co/Zn/Cd) transporter